jgi:hypothetical protein
MKELYDELRDLMPQERGSKASKWEILSKGKGLNLFECYIHAKPIQLLPNTRDKTIIFEDFKTTVTGLRLSSKPAVTRRLNLDKRFDNCVKRLPTL